MTHPYALEKEDRTEYLERSKSNLKDVLSQSDVQMALGIRATRLLTLAKGLYVPAVSQEGLVTLSDEPLRSNDLPMLALRDGERVMRDETFASFAPRQYKAARGKAHHFSVIASRIMSGSKDAFMAQTFEQEASVMRMIQGIPRYPTHDEVTYFNLRPLALMRYDSTAESVKASTMISVLVMADAVMNNPITVVSGEEGFDALNAEWALAGEEAGKIIKHFD
jgi:hypothetical protein